MNIAVSRGNSMPDVELVVGSSTSDFAVIVDAAEPNADSSPTASPAPAQPSASDSATAAASAANKRAYPAPAPTPTQEGAHGIRFDFNDGLVGFYFQKRFTSGYADDVRPKVYIPPS